jgi:prephenate dehydrogenase
VAGLGLMGGSMAMAIRKYTEHAVYGWNRTRAVAEKAVQDGVIEGIADDAVFAQADLLIVGLYPKATVDFVQERLPLLKKGCTVVDMVGVKQYIVDALTEPAKEAGVCLIGGHPMAGREFSGYDYATADLFQKASMILTPTGASPKEAVDEAEAFFMKLGFQRVVRCTPAQHDRRIAYTSQLCHVVSSAFIKSPEARTHTGFSAGSYRDLTRVARLNEEMWSELFLLNQQPLVEELDELLHHLQDYRDALAAGNAEELKKLLREGRELKEQFS